MTRGRCVMATREQVWTYAADAWDGEGTAYRNRFLPDPVHHIIVSGGIWCSGSRGRKGVVNNFAHRTCPKCMALAFDMYARESDEAEAATKPVDGDRT